MSFTCMYQPAPDINHQAKTSLFQPLTRKQMANRNRSSINMKNFKKFNAKRKWKVSTCVPNQTLEEHVVCRMNLKFNLNNLIWPFSGKILTRAIVINSS